MKKSIIALVLTAVVSSSALYAAETEHFRHLMFRETPFATYKGIHPISESESKSAVHYEFTYDDNGRVSQISRKFNDKLVRALGVWDSFIWFAPQVKIDYQQGKETHTYYDLSGKQTQAHGNVWRAVYTLGENNQRISLAFFDKDGKPTESEWNVHQYQWRPSDDNHIFEKRVNLAGEQQKFRPEFEFYEVKLEYDQNGQLAFVRNLGTDHTPTNNSSGAGIDRITYDLAGNFVRWQVYDKNGNAVEGNRPMVHFGEHLSDNHGNKIGLRGYDRFGKQVPFAWGSIFQRDVYNPQGGRVSHKSYKPDWSLDMHIVSEYSSQDVSPLSTTSLDEQGNKKSDPRMRGAAQVKYGKTKDGQLSRTFYDADGNEMDFSE